jgi:hypothetical protein
MAHLGPCRSDSQALTHEPKICYSADPTSALRSPVWYVSQQSQCHIAASRLCFIQYTALDSYVHHFNTIWKVSGIGMVKIEVRTRRGNLITFGVPHVLHVPDAGCNILGCPIFRQWPQVTRHVDLKSSPPCLRTGEQPAQTQTKIPNLQNCGFLAVGGGMVG